MSGCAWLIDNAGTVCGDEAPDTPGELAVRLCHRHKASAYHWRAQHAHTVVAELYEQWPDLPHTRGWTYVVLLSNGRVKIGFTAQESPLERLKGLHRSIGRVHVLAILPGGRTQEMILHHQFQHLRVVDEFSEQFEPAPELLAFAHQKGIHPDAVEAVDLYRGYKPRKDREDG